jgi:hypothetical protein
MLLDKTHLVEFARRYLSRYRDVVKAGGTQPLVAAALWIPSRADPFVGVSQWFERWLDPRVLDALEALGPLTPHHGRCAEPVAVSKALRWLGRGGRPSVNELFGGKCLAIRIDLTSGSLNPSTDTFGFRPVFGSDKPACASCQGLLHQFNITPIL